MIRRLVGVLATATFGFLSACGGGGGGDTTTAPSISTQPASVSVAAGASASFSVVASGSSPLSYQWRKGGATISGATSSTYSIASTGTSDAGSYDVVVSNSAGSVTSSAATLAVTSATATAPTITTQAASQTANVGAAVSFTVAASGSSPLAYQWRKEGTAISGATSATYTITSAATSDAGNYSVVVTNDAGSATSATAVLTVQTTATGTLAAEATAAAQAFLATLSSSQQSTAQLSWDLASARRWSNLPAALSGRNGIAWSALSSAQKTAARTLITTALGSTGSKLQEDMQAADDALVSLYGASSSQYGNGNYYIVLYGTPSTSGFWVLQLTGHHLTFNVAFNGAYRSQTPMFLGVEPKGEFTLNGSTYDPMKAQREAVSDLGSSLTSYSAALLSGTFADLVVGPGGSGGLESSYPKTYPSGTSNRGVLVGSLSSADQEKVKAVVRAYVNTAATENATELLAAYFADSAWAQTYVAYAGSGTVTVNGNYFRIDGPRVWIEYSVQRGVIIGTDIHFHTIWRDKSGDFGGRCCS